MCEWVERALEAQWPDWSYEEMIKAKMLFLDYLGRGFSCREEEAGKRLADHLQGFGGEGQATLFAGSERVPGPLAALGNASLVDAPLLFAAVLAAIEQQNKGGKELLAALTTGLEAWYRMGDHPHAELAGALLGTAHAFELDAEDGWPLLLGAVLPDAAVEAGADGGELTPLQRGLLAQQIVMAGSLAREEWAPEAAARRALPDEWSERLGRTADRPGLNSFLLASEVNADAVVALFRERSQGMIPAPYVEYYIDAVMGLEDICCIPLFFRQ